MATHLEELNQLISAMNENKIEYAVCGGLSLAVHGFARATVDINLLIQPDSLEKAYKIAAENGFDIRGLEPLKSGAFPKLMRTARFFRLIYCSSRRRSKTFGKRASKLIFWEIGCRSFRAKA